MASVDLDNLSNVRLLLPLLQDLLQVLYFRSVADLLQGFCLFGDLSQKYPPKLTCLPATRGKEMGLFLNSKKSISVLPNPSKWTTWDSPHVSFYSKLL